MANIMAQVLFLRGAVQQQQPHQNNLRSRSNAEKVACSTRPPAAANNKWNCSRSAAASTFKFFHIECKHKWQYFFFVHACTQ